MHVPEEMMANVQEEDQWRDLVDIALATVDPVEKFPGAEQINAVMNRVVRPLLADIARLTTERDEAHMRLRNLEEDHKEAQIYDVTKPEVSVEFFSGDDMRTQVAHLLWVIQPTQMPLEWAEAGRPTPQEICDYVTSALQQRTDENPLPDFDAATAYQEAALAEQRARIAAEERLHRMITALDEPEANLVEGVAVALYESPAGNDESARWRWDEHDDTVHEYWRIYARDALTTTAGLLTDRFGSTKP